MDWKQLEKNWKKMGERIQQKFSELSDEELDRIGGDRQKMQEYLQKHYDLKKEEAEKRLDTFMKGLEDFTERH